MGSISHAGMAIGSVAVMSGAVFAFGATSGSRVAIAQPAPQLHCSLPNYSTRRALPEPPQRDLTRFGKVVPGELTMRVVRDGTHYCYFLDGDSRTYVEAPTIRVRKDQVFTIRLIDELSPSPRPSGSAAGHDMTMPMTAATMSPDGCAVLDFDQPLPPPSTPGYLGKKRIFSATPSMNETDTNLHTHGFHVDPNVDNVFKVLSNDGTPGATRQCVYRFAFYPSQYVGTYWYHSHMHGIAQAQVGGGLAGTIIVDPALPTPRLPEHVLLIKDYQPVQFADTNRVAQERLSAAQGDPGRKTVPSPIRSFDPQNPPSWLSGQPITTAEHCPTAGRLVHWTVNGYPLSDPAIALGPQPPAPGSSLPPSLPPPLSIVHPGERVLYRAVNATSESFVNLRLLDASGTVETLDVVGRDGVPVDGHSGNPEALVAERSNVLLPPGGRADVVIVGQTRPQLVIADSVCTGYLGDWIPRRNIVEIAPNTNVPDPAATPTPAPLLRGTIATASAPRVAKRGESDADIFLRTNPHPARKRVLTFTQYDQAGPSLGAFYLFETTGGYNAFSEQPFWLAKPSKPTLPGEHFLPTIVAKAGTTEEWTLVNATGEVHAFHIHQLTFVTDFNPFEGGDVHVRQDVVAIPAAIMDPSKPQNGNFPWLKPEKVVIRMDFTNAQRGVYVYHCHMLFHEDRGMMGIIQVI
jgi:FtsP/CotA-like multicopper oxidase with cupredoxin domain